MVSLSKDTLMLAPLKKALESLKNALAQPKTEFTRDAAIIQLFAPDAENLLHELEKKNVSST